MPRRRDEGVDESKRATLRRFAALGAATPFAGLASASGDGGHSGSDASDSDAPDAITGYLATTPGAHFSKIRDDLQLGTGETQHHLRRLVGEGSVESRKDGDYRRYFPAGRFDEFEKVALGYLRRETPRRLVVSLLEEPALSAGEIAEELGVSRPAVSACARDLDEAGLLSRTDGYTLERPEALLVLLVRYADSFDRRTVRFAANADALVDYDPR
jgi:predicted transcriptional regulator